MLLENLSTREVFLFRIACSTCAAVFGGKPVRFSKAGIIPPTEGKRIIFEACYEQEFRAARQAAIREAAENLNYCTASLLFTAFLYFLTISLKFYSI